MAQDRSRRGRGSRARDEDYGWGIPIRGMYNYSLDYGGLGGPETDSETIPVYDTDPGDWTGPTPEYEQRHWAAREPGYGDSGLHARGRGEPYGRYREPGRPWRGRSGERDEARARAAQSPRGGQGIRWPGWGEARSMPPPFREELGGMTPAYERDPWWGRNAGYDRDYGQDREQGGGSPSGWLAYGREFRPGAAWGDRSGAGSESRRESRREGTSSGQRDPRDHAASSGERNPRDYAASSGERNPRDYPRYRLEQWEQEWERNRPRGFRGDSDFEAYDRDFRRRSGPRTGGSRPRRRGPG